MLESGLGLDPLVAPEHFDPVIRWVVTTDMLDPSRYLTGGELVLTGLMWRTCPADSHTFVRAVGAAGAAALAASEGGVVPDDLVEACRSHGLPLFRVPADIAFATVTESVVRQLSATRTSDLKAVLERHQRLVSGSGPSGVGTLLELVGTELGMECWALTASGRVLAGPQSPPEPTRLAREFLEARRLPHFVTDLGISLLPVDGESAARVVDWFIAVRNDWQSWHPEKLSLAEQLTSIVASERMRSDDRLTGSGAVAQEFVRAVAAGDGASELASHMRVMGLPATSRYVAVAAAVTGSALRLGEVRQLVRELTAPAEATIGVVGDEVIALVESQVDLTPSIEAVVDVLSPGLDGSGVSIGVSSPVAAGDMRSAMEEARHARQLAERRNDDRYVVGHDELASLVLLLAGVPDDVRRMFTARLLTPLTDYDAVHKSDLVSTLSAFLDANGSWTRCAEQMHLHVNSVRYRIQRIEELTGRDLSKLEDRVEFYLALRLT